MFTRTRRFLSSESCSVRSAINKKLQKSIRWVKAISSTERSVAFRGGLCLFVTFLPLTFFFLIFVIFVGIIHWINLETLEDFQTAKRWECLIFSLQFHLLLRNVTLSLNWEQTIILHQKNDSRHYDSQFHLCLRSTFQIILTTKTSGKLYTWKLASEENPLLSFRERSNETLGAMVGPQRCCAIPILFFTPARFFNRISRITTVSVKYSPLIRRGLFAGERMANELQVFHVASCPLTRRKNFPPPSRDHVAFACASFKTRFAPALCITVNSPQPVNSLWILNYEPRH